MSTVTTINWVLTKGDDGSKSHSGRRSGWTFAISTKSPTSPSVLVASHTDGRTSRSEHVTLNRAKEAALGVMHPAEAMAWRSGQDSRGYAFRPHTAVWGRHRFEVHTALDGLMWFQYFCGEHLSDPVAVAGIREARQIAAAKLEDLYGPVTPEEVSEAATDTLRALKTALRAAGIRYSADQLALAALSLQGSTIAAAPGA